MDDRTREFDFSISASPKGLADLKKLDEVSQAWHLSERDFFALKLMIDEVCTNYIEHAAPSSREQIHIKVVFASPALKITISDEGPPFDPTTVGPPDLTSSAEERKSGGLGLHFVTHYSDKVTYQRKQGGNQLSIYMKVSTI